MTIDFPANQREYDIWLEQERAHWDWQYNVIKTTEKLEGWTIISLERWKSGVVKFSAKKRGNGEWFFQSGFAADCLFYNMQLPSEQ